MRATCFHDEDAVSRSGSHHHDDRWSENVHPLSWPRFAAFENATHLSIFRGCFVAFAPRSRSRAHHVSSIAEAVLDARAAANQLGGRCARGSSGVTSRSHARRP